MNLFTALVRSSIILSAFIDQPFQLVGATDLKLKVLQEHTNALVPLDKDFVFYCGRSEDLNKELSEINLFETKIGEDGHPRCLGVENDVEVVAYHPSHGFGRQKVTSSSSLRQEQDVVITVSHKSEQDMAPRRLKSYDIAKFGEVPYRTLASIDPIDIIAVLPEDIPEGLDDCIIEDIDVRVTVSHSFLGGPHDSTLIHEGDFDTTSVVLQDDDNSGVDFFNLTSVFEGKPAVGNWTMDADMPVNGCGGIFSWGLYINCKRGSKSGKSAKSAKISAQWQCRLEEPMISDQLEELMPMGMLDVPISESVKGDDEEFKGRFEDPAMKAMIAPCLDGQETTITNDSFMNLDSATMNCLRKVFSQVNDKRVSSLSP